MISACIDTWGNGDTWEQRNEVVRPVSCKNTIDSVAPVGKIMVAVSPGTQ